MEHFGLFSLVSSTKVTIQLKKTDLKLLVPLGTLQQNTKLARDFPVITTEKSQAAR